MSGKAEPPLIVLVRPQLGENIGKAARAMHNFGLTELRLVEPRDGWPNPSAGPAAAGADVVLERARVFATLAGAVSDCAHVYATTVRKRGVTKPVLTPEEAGRAIRSHRRSLRGRRWRAAGIRLAHAARRRCCRWRHAQRSGDTARARTVGDQRRLGIHGRASGRRRVDRSHWSRVALC